MDDELEEDEPINPNIYYPYNQMYWEWVDSEIDQARGK